MQFVIVHWLGLVSRWDKLYLAYLRAIANTSHEISSGTVAVGGDAGKGSGII